jgi:hypothetical protein
MTTTNPPALLDSYPVSITTLAKVRGESEVVLATSILRECKRDAVEVVAARWHVTVSSIRNWQEALALDGQRG